MQGEYENIVEANAAFYRAFASLQIEEMHMVWLRSPNIQCVHPGGTTHTGWDQVMEGWGRIFGATERMDFELRNSIIHHSGELALVCLDELVTSTARGHTVRGMVRATNAYHFYDGEWLMILHHAS